MLQDQLDSISYTSNAITIQQKSLYIANVALHTLHCIACAAHDALAGKQALGLVGELLKLHATDCRYFHLFSSKMQNSMIFVFFSPKTNLSDLHALLMTQRNEQNVISLDQIQANFLLAHDVNLINETRR